jgi:hypothetical protein
VRRTAYLTAIGLLAFVLLLGVGAALAFSPDRSPRSVRAENAEEIQAVRAWGRLAGFPESAHNIEIVTEGSSFTRAFRVSFHASSGEVGQWIAESPGLRESTAVVVNQRTTRYVIEPGQGAAHAEVVLTLLAGGMMQVQIYTYWS